MPPISRYHEGGIVVPVAVLVAIDETFGVRADAAEEYGLYPEEAEELARLVLVPHMGRTMIVTDALTVSRARNVLDCYTLCSECEGEEWDAQRPVGEGCDLCTWCSSLILRDWLDMILDRAGHQPPAYIEVTPLDAHPDQDWQRLRAEISARYARS